jgi:transposase-like protein
MTRLRCKQDGAKRTGTYGKLRIQRYRCNFCRSTFAHAFSKKLDNLKAAVSLYMAFYNFVRDHQTLRVTPAMRAELTDHIWTIQELLEAE